MNTLFPLGFPGPTSLYMTLYVATLVVHVIFMNYVVAGTGYVVVGALTGRGPDPAVAVLRDWLTVGLSAAITAGVAPLLFIQILYKKSFYTANLLLFHRWMLILPALIVGFYLLYLLKTERVTAGPRWWSWAAGLAALGCFLFTGYSWTENHMLSQQAALWPQFYASGAWVHFEAAQLPRLLMWMIGALPTMATLVGWQLWLLRRDASAKEPDEGPDEAPNEASDEAHGASTRRLALVALAGLVLAAGCGVWYAALLPESALTAILGPAGLPWMVVAAVGCVVQAAAWVVLLRTGSFSKPRLGLATVGMVLAVTGSAAVREVLRLSSMDLESLFEAHAKAAEQGGSLLFLAFTGINAVLIGWCVWVSRRAVKAPVEGGPPAA